MEKFLTGVKRKTKEASEARKASNGNRHTSNKIRKYDKAYIALGFTMNTVGIEDKP